MSELDLIRRFRQDPPAHPWLKVGPGDDCAILAWKAGRDLAFKIDQIVEGAHFKLEGPEAAAPRQLGWKALAKAASDIAATGFAPVAATAAVNLRRGLGDAFALELYEGLAACCRKYGIALAGGDLTSNDGQVSVCVSMLGEGPEGGAWLRSAARPGDALLVTGALGGSRGGKHLDFEPRLQEAAAIRAFLEADRRVHPHEPRVPSHAPRATSHEPRAACIDITDGLARDAGHICEESGCGIEIDEAALPFAPAAHQAARQSGRTAFEHVLGDGEDFELLLALDAGTAERLLAAWTLPTRLTRIGTVLPQAEGRRLKRAGGRVESLPDVGFEHLTDLSTS